MKPLSQKRQALVEEFIKAWTEDDGLLGVSKYDHKELADHLTQALNDYTESIVRMVEERAKEVEKKQKTMLENDERDRNTYQRTGLKTDYDRVVLNEGTTAHLNAGRLMGKIEALNDIKEALNDTK